MGKEDISRREFVKAVGAALITGTVAGAAGEAYRRRGEKEDSTTGGQASGQTETRELCEPIQRHEFFDGNEEYFRAVTKRGEWTKEQRISRTRTLPDGERIFDDVGLSFYLVRKGDTISEIRERLTNYPEFSYLRSQKGKLDSFNISPRKLRAGMWLPIPIESKNRYLTEAQFVNYASKGIDDMSSDENYGIEVRRILDRVGKRELIVTMMAVAKQEAGGEPLGKFALHRWEAHHRAFSFSYFHILMKGPGLVARRKLNLTEGQLYHPQNAVKLFLAFLIEKSAETSRHADRFFPISEHEEEFARFYNGRRWRKYNPLYIENLRSFLNEADRQVSKDGCHWKKDTARTRGSEEEKN